MKGLWLLSALGSFLFTFASPVTAARRSSQMLRRRYLQANDDEEYEFPLEPFQIFYTVTEEDYSIAFGTVSMDRMTLLDVTRTHLEECFSRNGPAFLRISLYFSVRSKDNEMFMNGTQIAFGGNAYYNNSNSNSNSSSTLLDEEDQLQESIASNTMLCFLGQNETVYVDKLQRALGWKVLDRAQVMTVSGEMVEFSDGNMIMPSDDEMPTTPNTKSMEKSTSLWIYLVAILVPICALILLAIGWCLYRMRTNLTLKQKATADPQSPIWSIDHPQNHALRKATTTAWYQNQQTTLPRTDDRVVSTTKSDRGATVGPAVVGRKSPPPPPRKKSHTPV